MIVLYVRHAFLYISVPYSSKPLREMTKFTVLTTTWTNYSESFSLNLYLLNKLQYQFGIRGSLLNWLTSYLTSRSQYTVLNRQRSNLCSVSSGVPQGSVMGPTLFTLYTSDLVASIQSGTVYMYADDTTIYCIGKCPLR